MPELISATKAAENLGVSESFIRKRIKSGDLPAKKMRGKWGISEDDLADLVVPADDDSPDRSSSPPYSSARSSVRSSARSSEPGEWRDDLLSQVARIEADKATLREDMGLRIEASKARVIDLERELTARDIRLADVEANHATELSDLRGQVAALEAKVREVLEERAEAVEKLAMNITELVGKQQEMQTRVYELEPVASQVPMLQAAVEEKDATLSERERQLEVREHELGQVREDIDAIASRPVTGPVFRLLTKGRLRL